MSKDKPTRRWACFARTIPNRADEGSEEVCEHESNHCGPDVDKGRRIPAEVVGGLGGGRVTGRPPPSTGWGCGRCASPVAGFRSECNWPSTIARVIEIRISTLCHASSHPCHLLNQIWAAFTGSRTTSTVIRACSPHRVLASGTPPSHFRSHLPQEFLIPCSRLNHG